MSRYFRSGLYPAPSFPYMLGREGGGKVISLGPSPSSPSSTTSLPALSPGDSVAYMGMSAYAEYVAVPSLYVYRLPAGVSTETGAAGILQGLTALTMIREAYPAKAGDWVLVHAAAGGTGQWLCRLLKATGVRVIGTASSEAKREVARKAGAEIVLPSFNHDDGGASEEEFVKEVERITGGKGCDAVLDGVGKDTFESSMQVVKRKGWLISFGNASGAVPPFPIRYVHLSYFSHTTLVSKDRLRERRKKGELDANPPATAGSPPRTSASCVRCSSLSSKLARKSTISQASSSI